MGQMFLNEEDEIGEFEWEVSNPNASLDQYESMLSKYGEWISSKREIKIASLLNPDRKIQFDIESISIIADARADEEEPSFESVTRLKDSAIHIKGMTFILKEGMVEKILLKCRHMDTPMGKVVRELIDACIDLRMRQLIVDGQVAAFYVSLNNKMAA